MSANIMNHDSMREIGKAKLAAAALALSGRIASAKLEDIAAIKGEVEGLIGEAQHLGVDIPIVSGLSTELARMTSQLEMEKAASDLMAAASFSATTANESAMDRLGFLNVAEKAYLSRIDPNKEYSTFRIDEAGNIVEDQSRKIKGSEIREAFMDIKRHSLSHEDCEKCDKAAGRKPKAIREEMDDLHEALDKTESHHLGELQKKGHSRKARDHHERFKEAHKRADRVKDIAEDIENFEGSHREKQELESKLKKEKEGLGIALKNTLSDITEAGAATARGVAETKEQETMTAQNVNWEQDTQFKPSDMIPGGRGASGPSVRM